MFLLVCACLHGGGDLPQRVLLPWGSASRGFCIGGGGQTSQDTWDTTRNGQQAVGPHPTVMRSCFNLYFSFFFFFCSKPPSLTCSHPTYLTEHNVLDRLVVTILPIRLRNHSPVMTIRVPKESSAAVLIMENIRHVAHLLKYVLKEGVESG